MAATIQAIIAVLICAYHADVLMGNMLTLNHPSVPYNFLTQTKKDSKKWCELFSEQE